MPDISLLLNKTVARNAAQLVADAAQADLIRSKHRLSGDDSVLQNTWEEICVQVQGERGYFWDAYESAMRDAVLGALQFIDKAVQKALWLHTDDGRDLRYDLEADEEEGLTAQAGYGQPDIPVDDEAIARDIIANYLLPLADDYRNSRIEQFLCPDCDDLSDIGEESDTCSPERSDEHSPQPIEIREIEYYDDTWDSSNYLVCFNHHYIFAIRPNDPEPKWEFLPINSARWDAVHQRAYRNFRADRIERDQLPASLPPPPTELPPEAINPPPSPPPKPILADDFPVVTEFLHNCEGHGTAAIHLVLYEDIYESGQGDGEFHYPEIAFFDLEAAKSYKGEASGGYRYHIRPGVIWLDGDTIGYEVPRRIFDHFSGEEVLQLVTKAIEQRNATARL